MISDQQRREVAEKIRKIAYSKPGWTLDSLIVAAITSSISAMRQPLSETLADLIDRPTCRDLVEHKPDPFVPGKRMTDGFFYCSNCGWDGRLWEHVGFGDMLAYEAVHCPKCGKEIER